MEIKRRAVYHCTVVPIDQQFRFQCQNATVKLMTKLLSLYIGNIQLQENIENIVLFSE